MYINYIWIFKDQQEKHNTVKHWTECFSHKQKTQTRSASVLGALTPHASTSLSADDTKSLAYTHLVPQNAGPGLLLQKIQEQCWPGAMGHTSWGRTKEYTLSTHQKRETYFHTNLAQAGSSLSPGNQVFPVQSSFLCGQVDVQRLSAGDESVSLNLEKFLLELLSYHYSYKTVLVQR